MRKLAVPICNRTNYSKLKPVLLKIKEHKDIDVQLIPSSSIAVEKVGSALSDLQADGFSTDAKIDCLLMNDTLEAMSKTIGLSVIEHSSFFAKNRPDAVLMVGDRFDILPAAISSIVMNIPMLHIQGGERSGSVDDVIRDIASLYASRHYVATDAAMSHVLNIGRNKTVYNFGCPAVEYVSHVDVGEYLDTRTFKKQYKNDFGIAPREKYFVMVVHPDTTHMDIDMHCLLGSTLSFGIRTVVLYPNVDAFNGQIMAAIRDFHQQIVPVRHMPLEDFVKLMAHASCLIGNSSAGIREAASFGTPVVNVGSRQQGRERNINTIDCHCVFDQIKDAITQSLHKGRYSRVNIYYKPESAKNISDNIVQFLRGL